MELDVSPGNNKKGQVLDPTQGFYMELSDGSHVQVEFDQHDDLVLMLGDGMNQYVNPHSKQTLRPVPHALSMPTLTVRVLY